MNNRVSFHTLGCKLNFAETSTFQRQFAERGFATVDFREEADVVVINTCSVTENADRDARKAVRQALRRSPDAVRRLNVDAGAASIEIRLGARADTCRVDVETGASSVTLLVPTSVGCEVRTEAALSSKSLKDFQKINSGLYRSPNFDDTPSRMYISVESGLSSITVKREDSDTW